MGGGQDNLTRISSFPLLYVVMASHWLETGLQKLTLITIKHCLNVYYTHSSNIQEIILYIGHSWGRGILTPTTVCYNSRMGVGNRTWKVNIYYPMYFFLKAHISRRFFIILYISGVGMKQLWPGYLHPYL